MSFTWPSLFVLAIILYVLGAVFNLGLLVTLAVIAAVVGVVLLLVDLVNGHDRGRL